MKSRSVRQILKKKPCVHSRELSFDLMFMKLCQNVNPKKSRSGLQLGHVGLKNQVARSNLKKTNLVYTLEGTYFI